MDFVNKFTGGNNSSDSNNQQQGQGQATNQQGSSGGGFMDKLQGMGGGGAQGERDEDALDKAVDFVQEKFMGAGDQSNESAAEQAKDEAISDAIRKQYKGATGNDLPVADKDKQYGI